MTSKRVGRIVAAAAGGIALLTTGCIEDEEAQKEIERLNERIEDLEKDLEIRDDRVEAAQARAKAARDKESEAKARASAAESKLVNAEHELTRFRRVEERAREKAEAEPSLREKIKQAKETATAGLAAMITVKGDLHQGLGFVATADGKTWLYTAAATLAGNRQLEILDAGGGKLSKFGAFEVAGDAGLVRLEILDEVATTLTIGALTGSGRLLGLDAEGSALVEGRAYDREGGVIRVDSRISGGQPGSPVFDGESGKLAGVLIDLSDAERNLWGSQASYQRVQRVACPLDRELTWTAVKIGTFLKEGQRIEEADRLTRLIHVLAAIEPGSGPISTTGGGGGGMSMRKVLGENRDQSVVAEFEELRKWLASRKMKPAQRDVNRRFGSLYGQLESASRRQLPQLDPAGFSPFHREAAKQSLEWRKEAEEKLAKRIEMLQG